MAKLPGITKPEMTTSAGAIWDATAPTLMADQRLAPGDELLFAEYCSMMALVVTLRKQIEKVGAVLEAGDQQKAQKHPAWNAYREAIQTARILAAHFGIGAAPRKALVGLKQRRNLGDIGDVLDGN